MFSPGVRHGTCDSRSYVSGEDDELGQHCLQGLVVFDPLQVLGQVTPVPRALPVELIARYEAVGLVRREPFQQLRDRETSVGR